MVAQGLLRRPGKSGYVAWNSVLHANEIERSEKACYVAWKSVLDADEIERLDSESNQLFGSREASAKDVITGAPRWMPGARVNIRDRNYPEDE